MSGSKKAETTNADVFWLLVRKIGPIIIGAGLVALLQLAAYYFGVLPL